MSGTHTRADRGRAKKKRAKKCDKRAKSTVVKRSHIRGPKTLQTTNQEVHFQQETIGKQETHSSHSQPSEQNSTGSQAPERLS